MKKQPRGYAVPLALMVSGVTLFLGVAASQLSNGDLTLANSHYFQARARQASEVGLEMRKAGRISNYGAPAAPIPGNQPLPAEEPVAMMGLPVPAPTSSSANVFRYSLGTESGVLAEDYVQVTVYDNTQGTLSTSSGSPRPVPAGCQFWVSEGVACQGGRKLASHRLGAMVRMGMPVGSSGAMVRYLRVRPGETGPTAPIRYRAYDGKTGNNAPNEPIIATEERENPSPSVIDWLGQDHAVDLKHLSPVGPPPSVRLPRGVSESLVTFSGPISPNVEANGGQFNVPSYSPPNRLEERGSHNVSDQETLLPGAYDELALNSGDVQLRSGIYRIRRLVLGSGTSRLQGVSANSVRLYVDELSTSGGDSLLELNNPQNSAAAFQLSLRPHSSSGPEPNGPPELPLGLQYFGSSEETEGGVQVLAPGWRVSVRPPSGANSIRGSYCCEVLDLRFHDGLADFGYDISADSTRPSSNGQRSGSFGQNNPDQPTQPNVFNPGNPDLLQAAAPPELKPFILSCQPL